MCVSQIVQHSTYIACNVNVQYLGTLFGVNAEFGCMAMSSRISFLLNLFSRQVMNSVFLMLVVMPKIIHSMDLITPLEDNGSGTTVCVLEHIAVQTYVVRVTCMYSLRAVHSRGQLHCPETVMI